MVALPIGMGHVLDEHVHAGSAAGTIYITRRVAGEPQAMDKPPWADYCALGARTCAPPGRTVPWGTQHDIRHRREAHGREPSQHLRV